jgi:hypothetical protein
MGIGMGIGMEIRYKMETSSAHDANFFLLATYLECSICDLFINLYCICKEDVVILGILGILGIFRDNS